MCAMSGICVCCMSYISLCIYIHFSMYMYNVHVYVDVYMYAACICIHMAAPQKHRACNRPGRPFWDKACKRIRGLATNPPCNKPIDDHSTLHRGARQRFVTEGPRQRYVEGDRDGPLFQGTAIYVCVYRYVHERCMRMYMNMYRYMPMHVYMYMCMCMYM